jgi:hypothetical protein
MIHIARGRLSKEIAGHIGIAGATVNIHLIETMRKMNAQSPPELGRMADRLKLVSAKRQTSWTQQTTVSRASLDHSARELR